MTAKETGLGDRAIVGLIEPVMCEGKKGKAIVRARIDTGATKGSIDEQMVSTLGLGPVKGTRTVRNAQGIEQRPIVSLTIVIAEKKVTADFTVADRGHMRYPVLIGRNVLKKGFLIDPNKKTPMFKL